MYNLFGELEEKLDFLGLKRRYNEDTMICYSRIHQHMTTAVQYPWLEPQGCLSTVYEEVGLVGSVLV